MKTLGHLPDIFLGPGREIHFYRCPSITAKTNTWKKAYWVPLFNSKRSMVMFDELCGYLKGHICLFGKLVACVPPSPNVPASQKTDIFKFAYWVPLFNSKQSMVMFGELCGYLKGHICLFGKEVAFVPPPPNVPASQKTDIFKKAYAYQTLRKPVVRPTPSSVLRENRLAESRIHAC